MVKVPRGIVGSTSARGSSFLITENGEHLLITPDDPQGGALLVQ